MRTQSPISDFSIARLLINYKTIALLHLSFSLDRHIWSEILCWEGNMALNLILTNNFIYKVWSWQVIAEAVKLKCDATENSSDWWGRFECKSISERQIMVKMLLKYKSGTSGCSEKTEKIQLGSTEDWYQWLANFMSEVVRHKANCSEDLGPAHTEKGHSYMQLAVFQ